MLQRDVDVLADLSVAGDLVDQLLGEVGRVAVEQTDPAQALDAGELAQERGQVRAVLPIAAVLVGVFGDEVELERPRGDERAGLGDDVGPGLGAEGASAKRFFFSCFSGSIFFEVEVLSFFGGGKEFSEEDKNSDRTLSRAGLCSPLDRASAGREREREKKDSGGMEKW